MKKLPLLSVLFIAIWTGVFALGSVHPAAAQRKKSPPVPSPRYLKAAFPGDSLRTMKNATTFVLYSIDPGPRIGPVGESTKVRETFHGNEILGKVELNRLERQRALESFYDALVRQEAFRRKNPGTAIVKVSCFDPRHGIRAVDVTTGKRVDIEICFSCGNAYIHRGMQGADERNDVTMDFDAFGAASYKYFDALFRRYGVPLAP